MWLLLHIRNNCYFLPAEHWTPAHSSIAQGQSNNIFGYDERQTLFTEAQTINYYTNYKTSNKRNEQNPNRPNFPSHSGKKWFRCFRIHLFLCKMWKQSAFVAGVSFIPNSGHQNIECYIFSHFFLPIEWLNEYKANHRIDFVDSFIFSNGWKKKNEMKFMTPFQGLIAFIYL